MFPNLMIFIQIYSTILSKWETWLFEALLNEKRYIRSIIAGSPASVLEYFEDLKINTGSRGSLVFS